MTAREVLAAAAQLAGLGRVHAELVRDATNVTYRLSRGVVARIGPEGTRADAARQVSVARWLAASGTRVVQALEGVPQPTVVADRPVTWWAQLPEHRAATPGELGAVLRTLHALRPPARLGLPTFDAFHRVDERIAAATQLPDDARAWLAEHTDGLRARLADLRLDRTDTVIHGDAWQGNVAVPTADAPVLPVLLDLEHVSLGHPAWDLLPVAVDHTDFARLSGGDYGDFVAAYGGHDVTATAAYRVLADVQELRWTAFVISRAATSRRALSEAHHRIACLSGQVPRPWTWTAF